MITEKDIAFLKTAMMLASKGKGAVNPNPLVGAVIVIAGKIVAEGYHHRYGLLHAEREAFEDAMRKGVACCGATMYVTLEPCCHVGKQPPCTEAIISHGIRRVVIGLLDPNPLVAGKGAAILREAGITVDVLDAESSLAGEMRYQNRVFLKYITQRMPWVTLKYAMTLDGKISTSAGESKWITGPESLQQVHRMRRNMTAIACGIGTVIADDPSLTTRLADDPGARSPIRLVFDRLLRIPLSSQIVQTAREVRTIVVHASGADISSKLQLQDCGVETWCCDSIRSMALRAAEEKIDSILVEGGGTLNEAFIREGMVDEVWAFIAPKIFGGKDAKTPVEGTGIIRLPEALTICGMTSERYGDDVCLHGVVRHK